MTAPWVGLAAVAGVLALAWVVARALSRTREQQAAPDPDGYEEHA